MVTADIIVKLREEWGEVPETPPDWKEQERDIQDAFRESRTEHFAGRTAAVGEMKVFCLGEEARVYRLKALELFEQYVKLDPAMQKHDSYYRNKVNKS